MLLLAAGLALLATGGAATAPDLTLAVSLALLGYGMGLSVPPAMAAAIAAFPDARAGSGSGLVTAIRAVGGIFGVAVIGTAVSALYTGRLGGLPDSVAGPARASVANVPVLARHLNPHQAARLHATTAAAFSHGMRVVLLTCAAVAVLAALVSLRVLPPRADPEK
jgi:MFS family permease